MKTGLLAAAIWFTYCAAGGMVQMYANTWTLVSASAQDDTWTVVEYPENKEVVVTLRPASSMPAAKGVAQIMRSKNETTVRVDVSGLTSGDGAYEVYAVDMLGNATLLGTLTVADGSGSLSASTALTRFMIAVSPENDLTTIGPETKVALRSTVPSGFIVVAKEQADQDESARTGAKKAQTEPAVTETADYDVPLLGINSLKRGAITAVGVNFSNGFEGVRANIEIKPPKNGPTQIQMRFINLKEAPVGAQYVLWEVTPASSYSFLGRLTNSGKKNETKIDAETSSPDFGLFITIESSGTTPSSPTGNTVVTIIK